MVPKNRVMIQTMIYDVGLLKVIMDFIVQLYDIFED